MARKPNGDAQQHTDPDPAEGSAPATSAAPGPLTLTIQGIQFQASSPYTEGHPLTPLEANALNNLRGENLRNNFASQVKAAFEALHKTEREAGVGDAQLSTTLPGSVIDDLRAKFSTYESTYTFSLRGTRTPLDPIEAEATKLARAMVRDALAKNNINTKTLAEGKFDELVAGLLEKRPEIRDVARARVQAAKELASATLGMDLSGMDQAQAPAPAAEPVPQAAP